MGQMLSSQEELSEVHDMIGSLLYTAMLEGGALPDLGIGGPLLANPEESQVSRSRLQEHLRQLQGDMGHRAPTYLKDLIGRLSAFSDEPKLAGLVGLVVSMVMEMVYASSRGSAAATRRSSGSASSQQRVLELQEVMEEYLKRCRVNLSDRAKLIQDTMRLEAQLSLLLTQLKSSLLGQRCDTRGLRQWASAALFHTQMLVHLAGLEGSGKPLAAQAALEQYEEDVRELIPAYRGYKSSTVAVVKCRGSLRGSLAADPDTEQGGLTGLTLMDRESGQSVSIPLPDHASSTSLDLITSDHYARDYLDHLFGPRGPVAELQEHFLKQLSRGRRKPSNCERALQRPGVQGEAEVRPQLIGLVHISL
ncbi:uncharacterized protein FYW47_012594 [Aplochiton taeniatus]